MAPRKKPRSRRKLPLTLEDLMASIDDLTAAVTALQTAAANNASRVSAKLTDLQNQLAAAQAAGVTIPDALVASITAVTSDLDQTAA